MKKVLLDSKSYGNSLSNWLNAYGGDGLEIALSGSHNILSIIEEAGLRGLGGSGFPTYKKWQFVSDQKPSPDKYLICNGNEDEPGTFKDAFLLTNTPHQVVEGALITALANQINKIIFYINPEQPQSIENMRIAIDQWYKSDLYKRV